MNTKINWPALQTQTNSFTEKLNTALEALGIGDVCSDLEIDHVCIRLKNNSDVDNLKRELETVGEIISAVHVNGREIMIIKLQQPLSLGIWQTDCIELPYPKPNHSYEDGWEHVEFVLSDAENTIDGVRKAFMEKFPHLDIQKLKDNYFYSEDEPHSDADQLPNPTVGLKVNGMGLKFHVHPIQEVVGYSG